MLTVYHKLESAFRVAFSALGISSDTPIVLVEASHREFGDFQVNGIMSVAKILKVNPRELAKQVCDKVNLLGIATKIEVAGAGFINITLDNNYLSDYILKLSAENKYGVKYLGNQSETVIVDFSSPNLAKEMHVGHLRSTVIGDALARMFEYMGNVVIRQNHVGDWGTQFGMLIAYVIKYIDDFNKLQLSDLSDIEAIYRLSKAKFDEDLIFADLARKCVVILQQNDDIRVANYVDESINYDKVYNLWESFRNLSLEHCRAIYKILKINLNDKDIKGESFYNKRLPLIMQRLAEKNLICESNGAKCVFFVDGEISGSEDVPFIVQKSDGGYLYSTTDLAAMDHRVRELKADKIVYVVDIRQSYYFKQLFNVARKAGFASCDTKLEHASFGTMMNEGGKPFKTRDGGTVKLIDLVNEAVFRTKDVINKRNVEWSEVEKDELVQLLAIDAIKYSDLSKNRNSDYIFSFDKVLAFEGNTALYLLYAYTRVQSILKKANSKLVVITQLYIIEFTEHRLALHIAKFADMLDLATKECAPHYVCQYLYDLAGLFMQFYEACPILKAENPDISTSRLYLANLTAEILKTGLDSILGITVTDGMRM